MLKQLDIETVLYRTVYSAFYYSIGARVYIKDDINASAN